MCQIQSILTHITLNIFIHELLQKSENFISYKNFSSLVTAA